MLLKLPPKWQVYHAGKKCLDEDDERNWEKFLSEEETRWLKK